MKNKPVDIASLYVENNAANFMAWINNESVRLGSVTRIAGIAFLILTSIMNAQKIGTFGLLTYLPAVLLIGIFPLVHSSILGRWRFFTVVYWDVVLLLMMLGVCAVTIKYLQLGLDLTNAPIQMALIFACMISFHGWLRAIIARNVIYVLICFATIYLFFPNYALAIRQQYNVGLILGSMIAKFMLDLRKHRFYNVDTNIKLKNHAYAQMKSVLHPHQVEAIEAGKDITETMPVGSAEAVAISFDTIGSTGIDHPGFKHALEIVMTRCHDEMMSGYSSTPLMSSAYLVKNMGDGFFATVGFPFAVPGNNSKEIVAIGLAEKFAGIFKEEMEKLEFVHPISCAIGISAGTVEGYFPKSGVKAYDLRDAVKEKTIALAKRLESLVRQVQKVEPNAKNQSVVMIQERVWYALPKDVRKRFTLWNAQEPGKKIRDSSDRRSYYLTLNAAVSKDIQIISETAS